MEEKLLQKLSFLSRVSEINKNLEKDFQLILNFVSKISDFEMKDKLKYMNIDNKIINFIDLRQDIVFENKEIKSIHNNFSNKEDELLAVSLIIEKEKIEKEDIENA